MRNPKDIIINGKTFDVVLEEHRQGSVLGRDRRDQGNREVV